MRVDRQTHLLRRCWYWRQRPCLQYFNGLKTQQTFDPAKSCDRKVQVVRTQSRRHLGANTRLPLRHHRVGKGHHVDALLQHGFGKPSGDDGIMQHDRHDRVFARQEFKTVLLQAGAENRRVFL